nr:hypothetical protein [Bacteroidota bacterium]
MHSGPDIVYFKIGALGSAIGGKTLGINIAEIATAKVGPAYYIVSCSVSCNRRAPLKDIFNAIIYPVIVTKRCAVS